MTLAFLGKLGFKRTSATAVVHGPSSRGGMGVPSLYSEQTASKIMIILRHLRAWSPQGQLLLIAYRWWQHFSGMELPLLEFPQQITRHLNNDWWNSIKIFLATHNGSLQLFDSVTSSQSPRENDICLMQAANSHPTPQTDCTHF